MQTGGELKESLSNLIRTTDVIALDVETTGLDPFKDKLSLIQIGTRTERLVIDCRLLGDDIQILSPVLAHPSIGKLGHNLMFDLSFLEVNGLKVRGTVIDTYPSVKGFDSRVDGKGRHEQPCWLCKKNVGSGDG